MVKPTNKDTSVEREFMEYKFEQLDKRLERMESTMNEFAFVKQSDFDEFSKEVREKYVTKDSLKWITNVVGGIAIGVGVLLAGAFLKFFGGKL